ncbi:MAG TPA: POTRA domain-containing protein, partial [Isosphaeraceae bacterium]|nr:POTRA domain-containing protein [Isosphaeraceae bacterium]
MDRGSQTSPTARDLASPAPCPVARVRPIRARVLWLGLVLMSALAGSALAQTEKYSGKIVEIRVEGNRSIPTDEIRAKIHTRTGRDYDKQTLVEDVTRLLKTGWFADNVQPYVKKDPERGGLIVTFRVQELPVLRAVEFRGLKKIRLKEIEETTGLKVGAHADSMKNRAAIGQIKRLYEDKGYEWADVKLLEGGKVGDTRAIYQIFEGPKCRLLEVTFTGNNFVSGSLLHTKLASREAILGIGGVYHKEDMFEDVKKLTEYYQSQGFFSVKVRPVVRADPNMGDKRVEFVIWEGAQFKVRNVTFEGNQQVSTEKLKEGLAMHSGQPYSETMREADLKHLRNLYGSIGCIDAQIRPNVIYTDPQKAPGVVDIAYEIDEGSQYRLGRLLVRGNARTLDAVLRREANMAGLVPGEPIDVERLEKFKQRLGNLKFFAATPDQGKPIEVRIINRRPSDQPFGEIVDIDMDDLARARMQSPDDLETTPFGSSVPALETAEALRSSTPRTSSRPSEIARLQNPAPAAPPLEGEGPPAVEPGLPEPLAPGAGPAAVSPFDASPLFAPPVDAPVVNPGVAAPPNLVMPPAAPAGGPGTRTQPYGADVPPGVM